MPGYLEKVCLNCMHICESIKARRHLHESTRRLDYTFIYSYTLRTAQFSRKLYTMKYLSLYPEIEPYKTFTLKVSELHSLWVEECGNPDGISRRVPAWRAGCGMRGISQKVLRPEALPGHPVRPARLRAFHPACGVAREHDAKPGCGHRTHSRASGYRELAGVRWLVGFHAGTGLCRGLSRAGHRTHPARHLPVSQAGHPVVLPGGRRTGSTRSCGKSTCASSPRMNATTWSVPTTGA